MFLLPKAYVKFVNTLITTAHWLNVWLLMPSLLVLVVLDITLRNVFAITINWSHDVSGLLLLSIFFLDLPYCLAKNEFLKVDILYGYFPACWKKTATRLAQLGCLCIAVLLVWQGIITAIDMIEFGDTALSFAIPLWPFSVMIAVSGFIMAMQALLVIFSRIDSDSEVISEAGRTNE